jgi:hypothetical protein
MGYPMLRQSPMNVESENCGDSSIWSINLRSEDGPFLGSMFNLEGVWGMLLLLTSSMPRRMEAVIPPTRL